MATAKTNVTLDIFVRNFTVFLIVFHQRVQNVADTAYFRSCSFNPDLVATRDNFAHRKRSRHFFDVVVLYAQKVDERYIVEGNDFFDQTMNNVKV